MVQDPACFVNSFVKSGKSLPSSAIDLSGLPPLHVPLAQAFFLFLEQGSQVSTKARARGERRKRIMCGFKQWACI